MMYKTVRKISERFTVSKSATFNMGSYERLPKIVIFNNKYLDFHMVKPLEIYYTRIYDII